MKTNRVLREKEGRGVPSCTFYSLLLKLPNEKMVFSLSPFKFQNKVMKIIF
jgi:hypothetical protein